MTREESAERRQAENLRSAVRAFGLSMRAREWLVFFGYDKAPTLPRVVRCARAAAFDAFRLDGRRLAAALAAINDAVFACSRDGANSGSRIPNREFRPKFLPAAKAFSRHSEFGIRDSQFSSSASRRARCGCGGKD